MIRWLTGDETEGLRPTANRNIAQDKEDKFWFWDESNSSACGPYDNLRDCLGGIEGYVKHLETGSP